MGRPRRVQRNIKGVTSRVNGQLQRSRDAALRPRTELTTTCTTRDDNMLGGQMGYDIGEPGREGIACEIDLQSPLPACPCKSPPMCLLLPKLCGHSPDQSDAKV